MPNESEVLHQLERGFKYITSEYQTYIFHHPFRLDPILKTILAQAEQYEIPPTTVSRSRRERFTSELLAIGIAIIL